MAKLVILVAALCVLLPALVFADEDAVKTTSNVKGFDIHGSVYCDTCRAGFETNVTIYMPGAMVKLRCKRLDTLQPTYEDTAVTGSDGSYVIHVTYDHKDEICEVTLLSSSDTECAEPSSGRGSSQVILTGNNGMPNGKRFANNMGFLKISPLPGCAELIKSYFIE